MPIADPDRYGDMLDRAKRDAYAYPAINVTSSQTLHAALRGFAEAESDGIIQVSTGGAAFLSGTTSKNMVVGATALAEFAHTVAEGYPIHVALHTDHCPRADLDRFVRPLLAITEDRVRRGTTPLFQSHMWDGSALALPDNLSVGAELLARCRRSGVVLEVEIGVVGGEEDGIANAIDEKLYSSAEDALATAGVLGTGENGRYLLAATFGNVHGVYRPGNVQLRPDILGEIQEAVGRAVGRDKPFDLVFHGGSGSSLDEIRSAVDFGVVKMNIDTDAQYAYTRAVAEHMYRHFDGVVKVDGNIGNKKLYDPRSYGAAAEAAMATRVTAACHDLRSAGTALP